MRLFVIPALAGLVGGGLGAFAAIRWLYVPHEAGSSATADGATSDDLREQLREIRALLDRPRELAAAPTPAAAGHAGASAGASSAKDSANAAPSGRPSAELEAAIEKAVAAGIESARKQDPAAFAPPKAPEKKRATLAEVARELNLTSAQEDDVRRAYSDSTEKLLKLVAEPESTPDAIRRELEEAKGDAGKRTGIMMKYMPKVLGKLPEFIGIQTERDQRIRKAVGPENMPKYGKYKVAEEDPFGMDGEGAEINVSAGSDGR